jgi:protein deglycase
MPKVLFLVYPTFAEFEIAMAAIMVARTHQVVTVGVDHTPVTGGGGLQCLPHVAASEVNPAEYAGIVIPGGSQFDTICRSEPLVDLVQRLDRLGRPLAAICGGPALLGRAGVLAGRQYTASLTPAERAQLGMPEDGFTGENLMQDGNILTATGESYVAFASATARLFGCIQE